MGGEPGRWEGQLVGQCMCIALTLPEIHCLCFLCQGRHFWEIVASMSEEQQKKLLLFVTGSDRVPVGGVSEMKFKICKVPFQNTGRNDM